MRGLLLLLSAILISCSPSTSSPAAPPDAAANQAYLEKAAAEPGAVRTPSGLIYRELRAGTGSSPMATETVKVKYRGTLVDGKEFDSSTTKFPLNQVIPCWTEGVQKMKVGGKSQLVCPANIGYGARGYPPDIPGGATLVFEIELLGIG
jgi:FKBP-type peptidyl-prolyl cis-trans isomerase FkpA